MAKLAPREETSNQAMARAYGGLMDLEKKRASTVEELNSAPTAGTTTEEKEHRERTPLVADDSKAKAPAKKAAAKKAAPVRKTPAKKATAKKAAPKPKVKVK